MKRKTYNNVVKLAKIITKKGYDIKEAGELAIRCFDNAEGSKHSPEYFASLIISKEEWEREAKQI